jgi:aubergine
MRQETIYDILRNCHRDDESNWRDNFKKEILGSTVLTAYNNRTYRVDDIAFDKSPSSTFIKDDKEISFKEYYLNRFKLEIKDPKQPMLVSEPKPADVRAGRKESILLVPEFCRATGLTDKMRANFQMMKAMAEHTQVFSSRLKFLL